MARTKSIAILIVTAVLAGCAIGIGCGVEPTYFRGGIQTGEQLPTLAVLPPVNLSRYEQATDIVSNALLVEVLQTRQFIVLDPGLVEQAIIDSRLRFTDRLPLESLQALGRELDVTYVLMGTVNEFGFVQERGEALPNVSVTVRIVACANGRIVWAASHSRRGDDAESVFGMGRISTLEQLTAVTIREMTRTLE